MLKLIRKTFLRTKTKRENYSKRVGEYIDKFQVDIMEKVFLSGNSERVFPMLKLKEIFGDFPKAPWIGNDDILDQTLCLLNEIGYNYATVENNKLIMDKNGVYTEKAKQYFRSNESKIVKSLSHATEINSTISYDNIADVIPQDYPKAFKGYSKMNIIFFLKQIDMPFRFDNRTMYFF